LENITPVSRYFFSITLAVESLMLSFLATLETGIFCSMTILIKFYLLYDWPKGTLVEILAFFLRELLFIVLLCLKLIYIITQTHYKLHIHFFVTTSQDYWWCWLLTLRYFVEYSVGFNFNLCSLVYNNYVFYIQKCTKNFKRYYLILLTNRSSKWTNCL